MIKAYVIPPSNMSQAMVRVADALKEHASGVRIVPVESAADIVVLHVIGMAGLKEKIAALTSVGKKYAIIQYCLRTTEEPNCAAWLSVWRGAEIVWSYYDLAVMCAEDGVALDGVNFYFAPLGVSDTFRPWATPKKYIIGTSGYVAESEGVLECMQAVERMDGRMFHLGPRDERFSDAVVDKNTITDETLSQMLSRCTYVAGLRRGEGFELGVLEGLCSGARPVCFNRPHYRTWFEGMAEFIPEGTFEEVTDALVRVFQQPYRPVTESEIASARILFNWQGIAGGFWAALGNPRGVRPVPKVAARTKAKKRLLWIGDAVASTGFAKATHEICNVLHEEYDVHVLGLNYHGDPHDYQYPIYPARGGYGYNIDPFGINRIPEMVDRVRPDFAVVQNDPWNFPRYLQALGNVPTMGVVAVDGKNCRGKALNGLRLGVFWTQFGLHEARQGGYTGPGCVIPLGVDLDIFSPLDKQECRLELPFSPAHLEEINNAFIVGTVNRNQPRKRLDLTLSIFAEWIKARDIRDAYMLFCVAPTGEEAYDLPQLAMYYGIANRCIFLEGEMGYGMPERDVVKVLNTFDVSFSTSQGEGFHLPTLEAMACGVPIIAPNWSALGEWAAPAAKLVPCSEIACTLNRVNTIGGIIDRAAAIAALDEVYNDPALRASMSLRGRALAATSSFNWRNVGNSYLDAFAQVLSIEAVTV